MAKILQKITFCSKLAGITFLYCSATLSDAQSRIPSSSIAEISKATILGGNQDNLHTTVDLKNFSVVIVDGPFEVKLTERKALKAVLKGDSNLHSCVNFQRNKEVLRISWKRKNCLIDRGVEIDLPVFPVKRIRLKDSSELEIKRLRKPRLHLEVYDGSSAYINAKVENLKVDQRGASKLELKGNFTKIKATLKGASSFNSKSARINLLNLQADGVSKAEIGNASKLKLKTKGLSEIVHRKKSTVLSKKSEGVSEIKTF